MKEPDSIRTSGETIPPNGESCGAAAATGAIFSEGMGTPVAAEAAELLELSTTMTSAAVLTAGVAIPVILLLVAYGYYTYEPTCHT
jgi:hypothetical protein